MALILNEASDCIHLTAIGSDAGSNRCRCIQTFCLPQQAAFNGPVQDARQFLTQRRHQFPVLLCLLELPVEWHLSDTSPDTII